MCNKQNIETMKISKIFLLLSVAAIAFSACETLPKQEVTYSPTFPVSGEYLVKVNYVSKLTNTDSVAANTSVFVFRTYNTSSNTKDTVWARLSKASSPGTSLTSFPFNFLGKASCNITSAIFSATNSNNLAFPVTDAKGNVTYPSITILEGKVLLGKANVPSKSVCDSVYVKFTTAKDPKRIYVLKGHRRTGFLEDENL